MRSGSETALIREEDSYWVKDSADDIEEKGDGMRSGSGRGSVQDDAGGKVGLIERAYSGSDLGSSSIAKVGDVSRECEGDGENKAEN